jgi:hypothetical protein
MFGYLHGASFF